MKLSGENDSANSTNRYPEKVIPSKEGTQIIFSLNSIKIH